MKNNRYFDGNFVIQVTINMCWPSMQSRKMTMISDFIFFYLQFPSNIYDKNLSYITYITFDITILTLQFQQFASFSLIQLKHFFFKNCLNRLERSIFSPKNLDSLCIFVITFTENFTSVTTYFMFLSFICKALSFSFVLNFTWNNNALKICMNGERSNQLLMVTLKFNKCIRRW